MLKDLVCAIGVSITILVSGYLILVIGAAVIITPCILLDGLIALL